MRGGKILRASLSSNATKFVKVNVGMKETRGCICLSSNLSELSPQVKVSRLISNSFGGVVPNNLLDNTTAGLRSSGNCYHFLLRTNRVYTVTITRKLNNLGTSRPNNN